MKKVIALFFAVVMLLSLCACGKSDNAKVCEGLIGTIGEVTLESGETIKLAEEAYDALSEEEKGKSKKAQKNCLKAERLTINC